MGRLVYRDDLAVELTKAWLTASGDRQAPKLDEVVEAYRRFLSVLNEEEDREGEGGKG